MAQGDPRKFLGAGIADFGWCDIYSISVFGSITGFSLFTGNNLCNTWYTDLYVVWNTRYTVPEARIHYTSDVA